MNIYINRFVSIDELHEWGNSIPEAKGSERREAFSAAIPLWVERMINEGKLLLHPSVIDALKSQNWQPNEIQKKMIWASIVCKLDRSEQKQEKARIRQLIQNHYDNNWWEDVYERAGRVWPAWDRYRKNILSAGSATKQFASYSSVLGEAFRDEYLAVLKMVPRS